jgi:pimeloyl-ACP methyl ester carboxylesterase
MSLPPISGEEAFDIDVAGGTLHVGRWGRGPRTLLAIHGITANHTSMHALADALGDGFTVIAPDLRGRGGSAGISGPFGMGPHADDMVAVLDHLGIDAIDVLGHSMGAFVAIVLAHRAPHRVKRLILVDGGLPLDLPEALKELPVDELVTAVIGPALQRLEMTFESVDAYLDFWRPHPALADDWNDYVEEHYRYDLVGSPPALRSGVNKEAILADGGSELREPDVAQALESFTHPAYLLRAPRGLFNQVPPLYTDEWTAGWRAKLPTLRDKVVEDTNHYTIGLTPRGAGAVADVVRQETWG